MVKKRKPPATRRKPSRDGRGRTSFDILWTPPVRPTRGPKPSLTLESILQAGIDIADAEGLDALTMAKVAGRVGAAPMALYRHLPGKSELVELMFDGALGLPPASRAKGWRAAIAGWARANLAALVARPWLIEAVSRRTTVGPNWLAWLDTALAAFASSGLPEKHAIAAVLLVDGHVRSTAQLLTGAAATPRWADNFGRVLQAVQGNARYSTLTRLAGTGELAPSADDGPIPFDFGLQRILDGIEAFIEKRSH